MKAGASLVIPVDIDAYPKPKVEWLYNDRPLVNSNKVSVDTTPGHSTLTVKDMNPDNAGLYTLRVSNKAGTRDARFQVEVKGKNKAVEICEFFYKMTEDFFLRKLVKNHF